MTTTRTTIAGLAAALLLSAAPATAADGDHPPLALQEALGAALRGNPDLAAARELLPQAMANRDRAFAFIQPNVSASALFRVNDREVAFDPTEGFGDTSALTDAFEPIYGNIGYIYGELFAAGMVDADDCEQIAEINGFDDCDALQEAFLNGGDFGGTGDDDDAAAEPFIITPKEQIFLSADFSWPLSPRVITMASAGERNLDAARAQISQARDRIAAGVVQAYSIAFQAQEGLVVLTDQVALAAAHRKDTEALLSAGMVTKDALLRARVEEAKIQLQLKQLGQNARSARRALGLLMGRDIGDRGQLVALPSVAIDATTQPEAWARTALSDRPEGVVAESQALAARNLAIDAGLQFLPTVAFTGNVSWTDQSAGFDGKQTSWWLGLVAQLPIWDGGLMIQNARESASRKRQAERNVESTRLRLSAEALDAFDGWQMAAESLPVAVLERDLAVEVHRLVQVRYAAGQARQVEVLDARALLQSAELTLLQRRVGLEVAAVDLLAKTGQISGWAGEISGG